MMIVVKKETGLGVRLDKPSHLGLIAVLLVPDNLSYLFSDLAEALA